MDLSHKMERVCASDFRANFHDVSNVREKRDAPRCCERSKDCSVPCLRPRLDASQEKFEFSESIDECELEDIYDELDMMELCRKVEEAELFDPEYDNNLFQICVMVENNEKHSLSSSHKDQTQRFKAVLKRSDDAVSDNSSNAKRPRHEEPSTSTDTNIHKPSRFPSENYPGCRNIIWKSLLRKNVPPSSIPIMLASLSETTIKKYDTCFKKWFLFCNENNMDMFKTSVPTVIEFLTQHYESGVQYGSLCSCRSALSLILGHEICNDECIRRFFKGILSLCPSIPKNNSTSISDISRVLTLLSILYPNEHLNLEQISKKLATLLALKTAYRVQNFTTISINDIEICDCNIHLKMRDLFSSTRLELVLSFDREKPEICPAKTLKAYLELTRALRNSDYLFISLKKPYKSVTAQSISRWIKAVLNVCYIDVTLATNTTKNASV